MRSRKILLKAVSLTAALALALNMFPMQGLQAKEITAGEEQEDGEKEDREQETEEQEMVREVVEINNADDFLRFADNCYIDSWSADKLILLNADIDLTGIDFGSVPVFAGIFDGQDHTLSGFSYSGDGYVSGLFRYIEKTGVVQNLILKGEVIAEDEKECTGGLCGVNYGTIKKCRFQGTVSGKNTVGGLAGVNEGTGLIQNSSMGGRITGYYSTGGIAGKNHGTVSYCINRACINNDSEWVEEDDEMGMGLFLSIEIGDSETELFSGVDAGGIAGYSDGMIAGCMNYGKIGYEHTGYNIGGIVGRQSGVVSACTNNGTVYGRKDVGGIAGQLEPYIEIDEAASLLHAVNRLHDLIDKTLDDMQEGKNAVRNDLDNLLTYTEGAVDAGDALAGQLADFADGNMEQVQNVTDRIDYAMNMLPEVFDDVYAAEDSFSNANKELLGIVDGLKDTGNISGEYVETDYNRLTLLSTVGGNILSIQHYPAEGESVHIMVEPDRDYGLDSIKAVDANGNGLSMQREDERNYTFVMPEANVRVEAYFSYRGSEEGEIAFAGDEEIGVYRSEYKTDRLMSEGNAAAGGKEIIVSNDAAEGQQEAAAVGTPEAGSENGAAGTSEVGSGSGATGTPEAGNGNGAAGTPEAGNGNGAAGAPGTGALGTPEAGNGTGTTGASEAGNGNGAAGTPEAGNGTGVTGTPEGGSGNGTAGTPDTGNGDGASDTPGAGNENETGVESGIGSGTNGTPETGDGSLPGSNGAAETGETDEKTAETDNVIQDEEQTEDETESDSAPVIQLSSNLSGNASCEVNGDTATLTVIPDGAYAVDGISVTTADGGSTSVSGSGENGYVYTFGVSGGNVYQVNISFRKQNKSQTVSGAKEDIKNAVRVQQEAADKVNAIIREIQESGGASREQLEQLSKALGEMANASSAVLGSLGVVSNVAGSYALDRMEQAVTNLQTAMDSLKSAARDVRGIVDYVNGQPNIRFSGLGKEFDMNRENLHEQLRGMTDSLQGLSSDSSDYSDVVNDDLRAVNDQINVIFNILTDNLVDYSDLGIEELYEDVDVEDTESITTGKTGGCINKGIVKGDINVGGIAGAMSIDEEDPEDNAAGNVDYQIGRRYFTKCIITDSVNEGYITAKKDGAGGIVGYMKHGIVVDSESYGSVESTEGNYVGGICGESLTVIKRCFSLCSVSGGKNVGGIAGYADTLKDCYAMADCHASLGRKGAIAGQTVNYDDALNEEEVKVSNNYYVGDDLYGIDNISYMGIAEPISYAELLAVENLPAAFRHLKVTFRVDDLYLGTQEVGFGESLAGLDYPTIPEKEGYYGIWPDYSGEVMTGNLLISGEYKEDVTVVQSNAVQETEAEGGIIKPYALVEQRFTENTVLNAVVSDMEPPKEAAGKENTVYEITLENAEIRDTDTVAVRLYNPYGDAAVWEYKDGVWTKLESRERGQYLQVSMTGTKQIFCVAEQESGIWIAVMAAVGVVVLLVLAALVRKGKARRGKQIAANRS